MAARRSLFRAFSDAASETAVDRHVGTGPGLNFIDGVFTTGLKWRTVCPSISTGFGVAVCGSQLRIWLRIPCSSCCQCVPARIWRRRLARTQSAPQISVHHPPLGRKCRPGMFHSPSRAARGEGWAIVAPGVWPGKIRNFPEVGSSGLALPSEGWANAAKARIHSRRREGVTDQVLVCGLSQRGGRVARRKRFSLDEWDQKHEKTRRVIAEGCHVVRFGSSVKNGDTGILERH